jgi:hypothetical protein
MLSQIRFSLFVTALLASQFALSATLDRAEQIQIIKSLKQPSTAGDFVRIVTDADHEVPDPTRPESIELPNGEKKFVIGFSGQNIMMLNSLEELVRGGTKDVQEVILTNKFGFRYGGETDSSGRPLGYAFDSSTWDVGVFKYPKPDGTTGLRVVAGAMGTGTDGKPFLIKDGYNNTRSRLFFEAEFRQTPDGYRLFAGNPTSPLNKETPKDGNWIQKDENGKVIFSHGYGGEPVTLLNGELFVDSRGYVPFVHETVVEQRETVDRDGSVHKIPYRTALVVTYLDKTLSKVMEPTKIILDVFKPDGSVYAAAQRPTAGPLVEGAHVEVQFNGKPLESMAQVRDLQKSNKQIDFQILFSAGEYFGTYGSYMAMGFGGFDNVKPMVDDKGELVDITAPLRVLFTWIGRPVSFHVGAQEYLLIHGVDRSSLPEGITLDQRPKDNEWQYFKRQEIVVPIERTLEKGIMKIRLKDDSGLIEKLKQYTPRKVSKVMVNELATA